MRAFAIVAAVLAGLSWGGETAFAQQCPGVEFRVVQSTSELGEKVTAYMAEGTADLITQYNLKVEALLSAMRVDVAQSSTSASQVNASVLRSTEAAASAYVAGRLRSLAADAADEYSTVGYDACGVDARMAGYFAARKTAAEALLTPPDGPSATPGLIADQKPWYEQMAKGGPYGAGALFDGDPVAAGRYIDLVMGPPDVWTPRPDAGAASGLFLGDKLVRDARKDAARYVLRSVAAGNAADGPRRALQAVVDTYTGDGGERWAASMAGSHERGALLDAVRLEAAAVMAEVEDVRGQTLTELAAATYALTRADALVNSDGTKGVVPVSAEGVR